jgi:hypothetical protein
VPKPIVTHVTRVIDSPYLTRAEAAAYVRKTVKAFDLWVHRRGVTPDGQDGRVRLYTKVTLDRALQMDLPTWRRRRVG